MILSHIYSLATDDQVITIYENTEHHAVYELGRGKWYEDSMIHLHNKEIESFHWRPESITVYVKREESASVVIDKELNEIPAFYQKVTYAVDKTKIKDALKAGEQLDFAHLEQGEALRIK